LTLNGGGGTNTLVGSDAANTWSITGRNTGTLAAAVLPGAVIFSSVQNLTGSADTDTFVFADGQGVDGIIDGGGGSNTLDYSAFTGNVIVNLPLNSATGVGGGIANIQNVTGGGGPGYNILVGNGGNVLRGGNGRNLLIAGAAASTLLGGTEEDILIGGTTNYDLMPEQLVAIMDYWAGTEDYETRVFNVTYGISVPLLNATTLTGNGGGNTLTGGPGRDLFYGNLALDSYDWDPLTETFIAV
jgi:Ca2+-binding RTX toxin-like protein